VDDLAMPTVIRRLPFVDKDRELLLRGSSFSLRRDQTIVWLSVLQTGVQFDRNSTVPRFPAILDTGHNHNFIIQKRHLELWANTSTEMLTPAGALYVNNKPVELYDANVWLHCNIAGQINPDEGSEPIELPINGGIAISTEGPRLPLLGIRALRSAGLYIAIACERGFVSIRSPRQAQPGQRP
jgi:hypothetical protein